MNKCRLNGYKVQLNGILNPPYYKEADELIGPVVDLFEELLDELEDEQNTTQTQLDSTTPLEG